MKRYRPMKGSAGAASLALAGAALGLACAQIAGLSAHVAGGDGGAGAGGPEAGAGPDGSAGSAMDGAGTEGPPSVLAPGPMCGGPDAAVCPTGFGNCRGTGCDVSLTSDQDNCGACGRSCRGGECQDGECSPISLVTSQHFSSTRQLAVGPAGVTWGNNDGFIYTLPFGAGAQPIMLAQGEGEVGFMVVDDEFVYVMTESASCPDSPCIRRISLVPGKYPVTTVANVTRYSGGMAVDGNALYWYDSRGAVVRLPTHAPGLPTTQDLAINQGRGPSVTIAIDRDYVYWGTQGDTEAVVKRIHLDGSDVAPQHLASNLAGASAVAIDDTNVYWTTGPDKRIQMTAKQGGGPVVTLATDGAPTIAIAVDEVNVYWGGDGGSGGVRKVAKCGGELRMVAGGNGVFGIVTWMGNVYWNDNMSEIFREAQ
jgi:hypothetical protein